MAKALAEEAKKNATQEGYEEGLKALEAQRKEAVRYGDEAEFTRLDNEFLTYKRGNSIIFAVNYETKRVSSKAINQKAKKLADEKLENDYNSFIEAMNSIKRKDS